MKLKLKGDWRQYGKRLRLIGAIMVFVVGASIAYLGNEAANPLMIVPGFLIMAGGFMLFLSWRRSGDIRHIVKKEDGEEVVITAPPNSLNIYLNKVEFAFVENPLGQSQKCLNDGKYYHIHKVTEGQDGEVLSEFVLPDDDETERYYDPTEFANPVTMPSNKKYFTWAASTMQKISLGIMALIIFGLVIGMVVVE